MLDFFLPFNSPAVFTMSYVYSSQNDDAAQRFNSADLPLEDLLDWQAELWPRPSKPDDTKALLASPDLNDLIEQPQAMYQQSEFLRLENIAFIFYRCYFYTQNDRREPTGHPIVPGSEKFWRKVACDYAGSSGDANSDAGNWNLIKKLCLALLHARRIWLGENWNRKRIPGNKMVSMIHIFGLACKRRTLIGLRMDESCDLKYDVDRSPEQLQQECQVCLLNFPPRETAEGPMVWRTGYLAQPRGRRA